MPDDNQPSHARTHASWADSRRAAIEDLQNAISTIEQLLRGSQSPAIDTPESIKRAVGVALSALKTIWTPDGGAVIGDYHDLKDILPSLAAEGKYKELLRHLYVQITRAPGLVLPGTAFAAAAIPAVTQSDKRASATDLSRLSFFQILRCLSAGQALTIGLTLAGIVAAAAKIGMWGQEAIDSKDLAACRCHAESLEAKITMLDAQKGDADQLHELLDLRVRLLDAIVVHSTALANQELAAVASTYDAVQQIVGEIVTRKLGVIRTEASGNRSLVFSDKSIQNIPAPPKPRSP